MRFALIDAREADLSVERTCQLCEVSPSGYYAWQGRPASEHQRDDMIYLAHIRSAFRESTGTYGSLRMP
ncbi:MAG: hypothetical protein COA93_02420 [Alphaproteobacteria bacterium]|nr:MAG: hypothetical protein COA93_02420 [Alphaproteobacteria bacterium]